MSGFWRSRGSPPKPLRLIIVQFEIVITEFVAQSPLLQALFSTTALVSAGPSEQAVMVARARRRASARSPLWACSAPQQACPCGARTVRPTRASSVAVAWLTRPKSSGMTQPSSIQAEPTCGAIPGVLAARRRRSRAGGTPGDEFRVADALLTNFHLPRSTLIALVGAFAGLEHVLAAYAEAVQEKYRFYSYGDAMFIA